mgnify:CR=1 FL=1
MVVAGGLPPLRTPPVYSASGRVVGDLVAGAAIRQKNMQNANSYSISHARTQKERVPGEGEIGVYPMTFHFLHAL